MKKDTLLFDGYYGYENIGDDVFCLVADWIASEYWKFDNIYFNGINIPKLYNNSKKTKNAKMNKLSRKVSVLTTLLKSSHIVYAGGSNFHTRLGLLDTRNFYKFSTKFNKNLYALGVSIGPFNTKEDYESIKNYLDKFRYISLRDKRSYEIAKKMNLKGVYRQSFDIASLLPVVSKEYSYDKVKFRNKKDNFVIGISLCHYERYCQKDINKEEQREKIMKLLLDRIVEKHKGVVLRFFVFNNNKINGDNEITKEFSAFFKDKCKVEIVNYTEDTLWFWNEMKKCNLFIGIRLHSAIMSYMADIPFILFEYHEKCTEFLNSIGYSYKNRIDTEKFDVVEYLEVVEKLIKHEYTYKLEPSEITEYVLKDIEECTNYMQQTGKVVYSHRGKGYKL